MSELRRWAEGPSSDDPLEERAGELLRTAAGVEPWDDLSQARMRRNVIEALAQPPKPALRLRPLGLSTIAASLAATAIAIHQVKRGDLSSHLTSAADTQVQLTPATHPGDDDQLNLMQGLVNVHDADPKRGLQVRTPHLTATLHASSFFVEVAGERTTLFLIEGEAWIGEVLRVHLHGGQSIRSDDPRLLPSAAVPSVPKATAPPVVKLTESPDSCAPLATSEARFNCYLQVSMGSDQVAQNALFELGVIEGDDQHDGPSAIVTWGAYLKRFPQGSLAPEASFSILSEYLAERRAPEALAEASAFLARFPSDSRSDEVRLAAASLGCGVSAQAGTALGLLHPLLSRATGATRAEALFVAATCQGQLGNVLEARRAYQIYLNEFPTGPHTSQVRAQLASE